MEDEFSILPTWDFNPFFIFFVTSLVVVEKLDKVEASLEKVFHKQW